MLVGVMGSIRRFTVHEVGGSYWGRSLHFVPRRFGSRAFSPDTDHAHFDATSVNGNSPKPMIKRRHIGVILHGAIGKRITVGLEVLITCDVISIQIFTSYNLLTRYLTTHMGAKSSMLSSGCFDKNQDEHKQLTTNRTPYTYT